MPDTQTAVDRIAMRLAERVQEAANATVLATLVSSHNKGSMEWVEASRKAEVEAMAVALSSHGLREAVEALEVNGHQGHSPVQCRQALIALLGDEI